MRGRGAESVLSTHFYVHKKHKKICKAFVVAFHVKRLYFVEFGGTINYLICVRTNKSYE